MSVHEIRRTMPVSLDESMRDKEKRKKRSGTLEGILGELSLLLKDLSIWIEKYPLANIRPSSLLKAAEELKELSLRFRITLEDIYHYCDVIPRNPDNDIAEKMQEELAESLIKVKLGTLVPFARPLSFVYLIKEAETMRLAKLISLLEQLLKEIKDTSWEETLILFEELMAKSH